MSLESDLLEKLQKLSQNELKEVLATAVCFVQNPEKGIGTALFESLFSLVPQSSVEVLPVDNITHPTRVLLGRRAMDDPTFHGRTAALGTFIRLGETDLDAIQRCIRRELGHEFSVLDHQFNHCYNNPVSCAGELADGRRRHTIGLVYFVKLNADVAESDNKKWTTFISPDILPFHQIFLEKALGFQRTNIPLFKQQTL